MQANFALSADGAAGLNTIRGPIGGMFFFAAGSVFFALAFGEPLGFACTATLIGFIAIGRLLGFAVDGFSRSAFPALILEIAMIAILAFAYLQ